MENSEKSLAQKVIDGFNEALPGILRRKEALGQGVVYASADGEVYTLSAKEALEELEGSDDKTTSRTCTDL